MIDAAEFLPHGFPAVMLQAVAPADAGTRGNLRGQVRLSECNLLWMTAEGLPVAFSVEIMGQLSAVFLRRDDADDRLLGGRLAAIDVFEPKVRHLPADELLEVGIVHLGGSSNGYHKFTGEVRSEAGGVLASAHFSVVAFFKE